MILHGNLKRNIKITIGTLTAVGWKKIDEFVEENVTTNQDGVMIDTLVNQLNKHK